MDAKERAIWYLNSRMATCGQMRQYLRRKGYEDDEIDPVIEELKEYGYLDDLKYSRLFIEAGFEKGRGIDRIRRELRGKGVENDIIALAEEEIEKPDEFQMALEIGERIMENIDANELEYEEKEKIKARIARRLAARGYSPDVIYRVIGRLL